MPRQMRARGMVSRLGPDRVRQLSIVKSASIRRRCFFFILSSGARKETFLRGEASTSAEKVFKNIGAAPISLSGVLWRLSDRPCLLDSLLAYCSVFRLQHGSASALWVLRYANRRSRPCRCIRL